MPAKKRRTTTTKRRTPTKKRTSKPRISAAQKERDMIRNKEIAGIIIIAVSVLLLLNFILASGQDADTGSSFGVVSAFFLTTLQFFAGSGAIAIPIFLIWFGVLLIIGREQSDGKSRFVGVIIIFACLLSFLHIGQPEEPFIEYMTTAAGGAGGNGGGTGNGNASGGNGNPGGIYSQQCTSSAPPLNYPRC